jgi:chaperonin GroEL
LITKDGVTVAKFVDFDDPFENLGAQIIKQASEETNSSAGDGTTTSTMLARAILDKSQSHLVAGISPIEIKRGIDMAVTSIVKASFYKRRD